MTDLPGGRGPVVAAAVSGVGLSGAFDGILRHQVLPWRHLLSLVPGEVHSGGGVMIVSRG